MAPTLGGLRWTMISGCTAIRLSRLGKGGGSSGAPPDPGRAMISGCTTTRVFPCEMIAGESGAEVSRASVVDDSRNGTRGRDRSSLFSMGSPGGAAESGGESRMSCLSFPGNAASVVRPFAESPGVVWRSADSIFAVGGAIVPVSSRRICSEGEWSGAINGSICGAVPSERSIRRER